MILPYPPGRGGIVRVLRVHRFTRTTPKQSSDEWNLPADAGRGSVRDHACGTVVCDGVGLRCLPHWLPFRSRLQIPGSGGLPCYGAAAQTAKVHTDQLALVGAPHATASTFVLSGVTVSTTTSASPFPL